MRPIEVAAAYIAGYGVKLWMVLQDLQQLQGLYPKSWATFLGNAGVLQCFANADQPTLEYLSKRLGDVELRQVTRSQSQNKSTTVSRSESTSETAGRSTATSRDKSVSRRPKGIIFLGKKTSESETRGTSQSTDKSSTTTFGKDTSHTEGQDAGFTEVISVAPLMRPDEIERHFSRAAMLQLVIVSGDYPVVLSRSHYFSDAFFDSKFDPHPAYPENTPLTLAEKAKLAHENLKRELALAQAESERKDAELDLLRRKKVEEESKRNWLRNVAYGGGALIVAAWMVRLGRSPSSAPEVSQVAPANIAQRDAEALPSSPPVAQPAAQPAPPAPSTAIETMAVASVGANLREEPNELGNVIATVKRGDRLTLLARSDGFFRVVAATGIEGWVSDRLVIADSSLKRLESLSPEKYAESQGHYERLKLTYSQLSALLPTLKIALQEMMDDAPTALDTLKKIDVQRALTIDKDQDAAKWFGLAAEYEEKSNNFSNAAAYAFAAMLADPSNPDHYNRYCLACYQLGRIDLLQIVAPLLPLLAPLATNTWLIAGIGESASGKHPEAVTFFRYAVKLSRNQLFTRKYFQDLAAKTGDQRVASALRTALSDT